MLLPLFTLFPLCPPSFLLLPPPSCFLPSFFLLSLSLPSLPLLHPFSSPFLSLPFLSFSSALLFSATFRKRVERLCRDTLTDPVRIVVGDVGEANTDITQIVEVMQDEQEKWQWLLKHLVEFTSGVSIGWSVSQSVGLAMFSSHLSTHSW